ncbi:MAG: undecaprenyl/decaprenyl-phosphate alpha-N-acetylglucosaminyl 1-phosphate transferase [Gammaproteobacteria bacterium]|nr:undecaprenyl/decaprenyl-phosphate alpha-N-acetylglucosaminyl 1-phosphate transferase [Gammaproteobacteria bacterium]MDH3512964.1 undecaprenyl/decaprenyl-phosphate alpha-N-acetylglucosaminyl 1-phosphate transferase [Gammaproteobacteria bacterium]
MSVLPLVPSLFVAFFVTLLFIAALRPLARSINLVDMPGGRKRHVGEIPVIGGIAMFLGFIIAWSVLPVSYPTPLHLGVAGVLLVTIGALDDRFTMPPSVRFLTQTSVVLIMVYGAGIRMYDIGDPFGFGIIQLGPLSLFITALITVSVINAFNMMDGIDGLAGTMALIAMISIALVAGYQNPMAGIALIAASSVIAFLMTNFPTIYNRRARTFMGDAGSMFIGFVVVWVTMSVSQGAEAVASPVICLWFAAFPIFDLFTRFVRRSRKGHSPLRPARDHFHHTLMRSGMGVRLTLGVLTGLQLSYAIIGLIGHFAGAPDVLMFMGWSVLGISQHWIIDTLAARFRLGQRRKRVAAARITVAQNQT